MFIHSKFQFIMIIQVLIKKLVMFLISANLSNLIVYSTACQTRWSHHQDHLVKAIRLGRNHLTTINKMERQLFINFQPWFLLEFSLCSTRLLSKWFKPVTNSRLLYYTGNDIIIICMIRLLILMLGWMSINRIIKFLAEVREAELWICGSNKVIFYVPFLHVLYLEVWSRV